jgi:hypothetical protein
MASRGRCADRLLTDGSRISWKIASASPADRRKRSKGTAVQWCPRTITATLHGQWQCGMVAHELAACGLEVRQHPSA